MINFVKLFEPGKIGKLQLKNRAIMSPMVTRYATSEGAVSDRLIEYYAERARGGVALIVIEASYPLYGGYPGRLAISEDHYILGLAKLVRAIHEAGSKVMIELNPHRGRADEVDPASASAVPHPSTGVVPRQLSTDEIKAIVRKCGEGARRARDAGFDAVMIHGASGYLVSEFLSPRINQRADEYGGDAMGRARLALELVEKVKQTTGHDYPVVFRLVGHERIEEGFSLEDAVAFCQMLVEAGVDALDVGSGAAETYEWVIPCMYLNRACNVDLSEPIKAAVSVPVIGVGRIDSPELAEDILRKGKADFIAMGRALIADPHLLAKAGDGKIGEILGCIACLKCVERVVYKGLPLLCTVNPNVGSEGKLESKATTERRVLVVGGGPGGLEAAIAARRRGHDVTLWEKGDMLGGQMILAAKPPGKEGLNVFLEHLLKEARDLEVKVECNKTGTADSVMEFSPDVVVVATGSVPFIPNIEGADSRITVTNRDVLSSAVSVGQRVVVIGGGSVGCETADFLAEQGKSVTIVEILERIANDVIPNVRNCLMRRLHDQGIATLSGIRRATITNVGVKVIDKDGKEIFLEADSVVLATGSLPDTSLYQDLKDTLADLYHVGDCAKARSILEAVSEGAGVALMM